MEGILAEAGIRLAAVAVGILVVAEEAVVGILPLVAGAGVHVLPLVAGAVGIPSLVVERVAELDVLRLVVLAEEVLISPEEEVLVALISVEEARLYPLVSDAP